MISASVAKMIGGMQMPNNEKMLQQWLANQEQHAFELGVAYACEHIHNKCSRESMPILVSQGDTTFYISMKELVEAINETKRGAKDDNR